MKPAMFLKKMLKSRIVKFFLIGSLIPVITISAFIYLRFTEEITQMKVEAAIILSGAILFILLLAALLRKDVMKPIDAMKEAAYRLTTGDIDVRVNAKDAGEFGALFNAFNRMAAEIERTATSIKSLRNKLSVRMASEEELKASKDRFGSLAEQIDEAVFRLSMRGIIKYINPAAKRLCGYKEEDLIGKHFQKAVDQGDMVKVLDMIEAASKEKAVRNLKLKQLNTDGKASFMKISALPIADENGRKTILVVAKNLSERRKSEIRLEAAYYRLKKVQSQLIQSEKMKVVGVLASGVAHEVKNPLSVIMQAISYMENKLGHDKKELHDTLIIIKNAATRADKIVRGMLDFSRPDPLTLAPNELNEVINAAFSLAAKQLTNKNIKTDMRLAAGLPLVMIDRNQMEQVFINIILNSLYATPPGGKLTAKTYVAKPADMVVCEIIDTGKGIPKSKLGSIFDPFFTTKPPGEGTGLGLAIIKTIVEKHKGTIVIESEKGKGAKVILTLPITKNGRSLYVQKKNTGN